MATEILPIMQHHATPAAAPFTNTGKIDTQINNFLLERSETRR
jgi:hypothetical protein